ncbi:DUF2255 family protein [Flavobacterium kingsejongi]|uniref:DUF2255 domain-containing protein n=1 Tax=Flavobacterium kingsejongi TaxID=1678728 RepID=A0A2S1LRT9_9FLAO|nr:DUF2255 family protein [Flavobacterium kingsejongi]AWG26382.1 hypothetical protein FK004_14670 [Flavobacterium kingsejongi]
MEQSNQELAVQLINATNLIGIKAGMERETFTNIWMVAVGNRIFARSWSFAEKSWYNTFLTEPIGYLQCGERQFQIKADIPEDSSDLSAAINVAYLKKYNHGKNSKYATGITAQKHVEKTMEFSVISK